MCVGTIHMGGIETFYLFLNKNSENIYPEMFQYPQTKIRPRWQSMLPVGKMFQYTQFAYYLCATHFHKKYTCVSWQIRKNQNTDKTSKCN